jgi:hypothetical protein
MLTVNEVTEIFYLIDEFSKEFDILYKKHLLPMDDGKRHRNKPDRMFEREVMTILIALPFSLTLKIIRNFCIYG